MSRALVWLLLMFIAPSWSAAEGGRTIRVAEHAGMPPLDPADLAWTRAPATSVALYPQATAPGGPGGAVLPLEARALRGGGRLAVRLAWTDAHENSADTHATHRFADAVAVQFAPTGKTLPYVGMGEPGQPVQIWFWRAGQPAQRLAGQGFGSLGRSTGAAPEARARRTAGGWEVVLRGEADARPGAAIAFAAWDGAEDGRAGRKRLSAWQALSVHGGPPSTALRAEAHSSGDPSRGARLYTEHGCVACHAPGVGLGPNLVYAGGIHWPGYLRRAILEPAAFRVPGYASAMPALPLHADEVEDLVAYLMSLH
jgi:DMSO reductase family type II enzyme heme b subunit